MNETHSVHLNADEDTPAVVQLHKEHVDAVA